MGGSQPLLIDAAIVLQIYVVLFVALHDYAPLAPFNDVKAIQASEPKGKLFITTVLSTAPFAFGLVESFLHAGGFPRWLMIFLWVAYAVAGYGLVRTWWAPYLVFEEPARAARYHAMHGATHAFLPLKNGLRPNTLHVTVHTAIICMLLILGALSFAP
jgi:hypothetical protein